MTTPSYLEATGLPPSVCAVLHVLSACNQLEALRLASIYEANVIKMHRLEAEKKHREVLAKAALARRASELNKAELKRLRKTEAILELFR